jgi:hypothetical protein
MSEGGEHVHQQTIQKIEKGTRPLKYAEALKICEVLKISIHELSDDPGRNYANAEFMQRFAVLNRMGREQNEFAERLGPLLIELADWVEFQRSNSEENQADAYMVEEAESWLSYNWGKILNLWILSSLRTHPYVNTIISEVDAPTYAEVLRRVADPELRALRPDIGDTTAVRFDESET